MTEVPIIAACGNNCAACPRYTAHPYEKSDEELYHTAELWMKIGYRDHIVSKEEISCTGCRPENWCRYHVVKCCEDEGIKSCAECSVYPCDNMQACFTVTKSFESKCRQVCTEQEYATLKKAFFEKGQNLKELQKKEAIKIREITSKEAGKLYNCLEALAEHHNKVSVHFKGQYPQTASEQKTIEFGKELEEGKSYIAVAENDTEVIGFCKINIESSKGVLEYLVVLDQERGKGYGAALMDWALDRFRGSAIKDIDVKVVYGNDAIHLYEKYGFRERSVILTLNLPVPVCSPGFEEKQ